MTMKIRCIVILLLLGSLNFGCQENVTKKTTKNIEMTSQFLEAKNSDSILVKGTKLYDSITQNYPMIEYSLINKSTWLRDSILFNRLEHSDSIEFQIKQDSSIVKYYFFSTGRCLNFYPFYTVKGDSILIHNPELVEAALQIEGNDTIVSLSGCSLSTISELILKIPFTDKKIIFNNKLVNLKRALVAKPQ